MIEVEVNVPSHTRPASVARIVERICIGEGLTLTMKGTLAKYPNGLHWHFKKGKQPGTLEVTWWEFERRLWFKVATGRGGGWIEATTARLKYQIELALR